MRLSTRPGRTKAGSNKSARLVAPIKKMPVLFLNPSKATNNSFKVLSRSEVEVSPSEDLFLPNASISSIKIIQGIFSLASLKSSRTRVEPTPTYFS